MRELQRALKDLDGQAQKELRVVNLAVAEQVASKARGRARALGGVAAHVAPSIKAHAEQRRAGVRLGDDRRYEMAVGAEFGSIRYKQFPPWRGSDVDAGYFLYPTLRSEGDHIEERYDELLRDLIARYF